MFSGFYLFGKSSYRSRQATGKWMVWLLLTGLLTACIQTAPPSTATQPGPISVELTAVADATAQAQADGIATSVAQTVIAQQFTFGTQEAGTQATQAALETQAALTLTPPPTQPMPSATPLPIKPNQTPMLCGIQSLTGNWEGYLTVREKTHRIGLKLVQRGCNFSGTELTGAMGSTAIKGDITQDRILLEFINAVEGNCDALRAALHFRNENILEGRITTCNGGFMSLTRLRK